MVAIEGVVPILTTPFTDTGAVDADGLRGVARAHVETGCTAITLFGLASEFYKLTDDERDRIAETVIGEVGGDLPVIYSVTDHATRVAVERARQADRLGADAIMVLPPFFLAPPVDQICAHVERIADVVSGPVILQYAPQFTGTILTVDTLAELADRVPNLEYYKIEASPTGPYISDLQGRSSADTLVGNAGWQMLDAYDRGAVGVMPGSPFAPVYVEIQNRYDRRDRPAAAELHAELLPLLNHVTQSAEMAFYYGKRVLYRRDLIETPATRAPAYDPDPADDERFETLYETIEPWL